MTILQVYNEYRSGFGGESAMVRLTADILTANGHRVVRYERDSRAIVTLRDRAAAFASSIYSVSAAREMTRRIDQISPDIVHVHNLYPLFSPSILTACRKRGLPTVMSIHNYTLTCPIGLHLYRSAACTHCLGGREYWCMLHNCAGSPLKSVNYALRNALARRFGWFRNNVTMFIAMTSFMRGWLVTADFPRDRIAIVPNTVPIPEHPTEPSQGGYALFAGRIEWAKGIGTLLDAAASQPHIPVMIAGDGPALATARSRAPGNVIFAGRLSPDEMATAYRGARVVVFPSLCFEGFGLAAAEAMSHGIPLIAADIGGIREVVEDSRSGILVRPGDAGGLSVTMDRLWRDDGLCRRLGAAGRETALARFSPDAYHAGLMSVYERAMNLTRAT